jgi:hypothetical protein
VNRPNPIRTTTTTKNQYANRTERPELFPVSTASFALSANAPNSPVALPDEVNIVCVPVLVNCIGFTVLCALLLARAA